MMSSTSCSATGAASSRACPPTGCELLAYRTCGRAMVQSWGIIGIGLSAFALSSFVPTFRFGMLMLLLLTAGLVGNLLFLPALLAGPIGRWIASKPAPFASLVHLVETPEPEKNTRNRSREPELTRVHEPC